MPRRARTIFFCLALAAGATLAGCGGDDDTAGTPAPPVAGAPATTEEAPEATESRGDEVAVEIKDIKFNPEEITVKVGQKIVWTNNDGVPHDVTAQDGADFKSDTLQMGDTFEFTPTEAGKIAYVCTIHSGQNGSITVTE